MPFDPSAHLIQLPQRKKDDHGRWVTTCEQYLPVKWRLCWFREKFPHGTILTEAILLDWDKGIAIHKATVGDGAGGIAMGTGSETREGFQDFVEKSESRAIGRALAALGIGTQFVGNELDEGDHIADAGVAVDSAPVPPAPAPEPHPSTDEITMLFESARAAHVSVEDLGHDLRRVMGLSDGQKITKKFLHEQMSMSQYNTVRKAYGEKLRQIIETDVPEFSQKEAITDATIAVSPPASAPVTAHTPAAGAVAVPAPAGDAAPDLAATDAAREALIQEACGLGLDEREVRTVVSRHRDLQKARELLMAAARRRIAAA